jgi:hypothetical protein
MADNIHIRSGRGTMHWLTRIPWTFLLIAYLLVIQTNAIDMTGVPGYVFIGLGVVVLFVEFFKSGDINNTGFFVDMLTSVLAVVTATALMVYLFLELKQTPTFFHWFGYAIILGDAIFSPFNAFRTALRNFGVDN